MKKINKDTYTLVKNLLVAWFNADWYYEYGTDWRRLIDDYLSVHSADGLDGNLLAELDNLLGDHEITEDSLRDWIGNNTNIPYEQAWSSGPPEGIASIAPTLRESLQKIRDIIAASLK